MAKQGNFVVTKYGVAVFEPVQLEEITSESDTRKVASGIKDVFEAKIMPVIEDNRLRIVEDIQSSAKGEPYSILSWNDNHSVAMVNSKLVISVLSTAVVVGDFELEDDE